jgi:hypothetical protein
LINSIYKKLSNYFSTKLNGFPIVLQKYLAVQ